MQALVDPVGNRTTYAYDGLNRATQETDPFGNNATLAYASFHRETVGVRGLIETKFESVDMFVPPGPCNGPLAEFH
jgi:YD repeat-containing protein